MKLELHRGMVTTNAMSARAKSLAAATRPRRQAGSAPMTAPSAASGPEEDR